MKITIVVDDSLTIFEARLSKTTYDAIPQRKKPPLYPDSSFFMGDLERFSFKVNVDETLFSHNTLYVHSSVKSLYYSTIEEIEVI